MLHVSRINYMVPLFGLASSMNYSKMHAYQGVEYFTTTDLLLFITLLEYQYDAWKPTRVLPDPRVSISCFILWDYFPFSTMSLMCCFLPVFRSWLFIWNHVMMYFARQRFSQEVTLQIRY